jgi:hypothetical protein
MTDKTPGIFYAYFYEDDDYQLWAFDIPAEIAGTVQEAWDQDDWMQDLFKDISEQHGTLDVASEPCDAVHGIGIFSTEIDHSDAPLVMNAWRIGICEKTGNQTAPGEVKMLQAGNSDDDPEFTNDADIYETYQNS